MTAIGSNIPPTIPFRVAQAYGAAARIEPKPSRTLVSDSTAASPGDLVRRESMPAPSPLVAARVDHAEIDFSAHASPTSPGSLAFYRHPADRNAVATSVALGASLDVSA